jgi:hypothetical protein
MSDACSQCPDNKECVEETVKRWRRRVNEEKSDKPCPFLTVQTYSTLKGEMKRHYCTARGLKDILPKTTWKNICLKGETCVIRQNVQGIIEG